MAYFRPGHETFAGYKEKEPLLVVENAVRWLGGAAAGAAGHPEGG